MKGLRWVWMVVLLCGAMSAQNTAVAPKAAVGVNPADTKTVESTLAALYDVISGPSGASRNWERFRGLFLPEGLLVYTGKMPDGKIVHRVMTPQDYQTRATPMLEKEGFFERSVANHVDRFGNIAQVFSTYESRHEKDGAVFARGINSIQLLWDGDRWWVVSVLWDSEREGNAIPEKYAK